MNENVKTNSKVFAANLFLILILSGCGQTSNNSTGSNAPLENPSTATREENIETKLRKALANPSAVVVVKDTDELYWAIPVSGVKEVNQNQLILNQGTRIAAGSGKGTPVGIAELLINQRSNGGPYFVSNSGETSVTGQTGETKKITTVEVKEFILSK